MLNPNNDRLYYGRILSPPSDYELDFAIGTTYTLDLDALVGASISLSLSGDIDSNLVDNPIYLLDTLIKKSDDIALFCENGQIKLPTNTTPLYILLENMVFQVKTSKQFQQNRFASFHPKFWLLRYINGENNVLYRLVVLSRNLTFDRSWDTSFAMDGYKNDEITDKNDVIITFIDYLADFSTDEVKKAKIQEIKEELKFIDFKLHSNIFNDFEFFVNGINDNSSIVNSSLFKKESLDELMIVSPFLSKKVIRDFNNRKTDSSKALLFTRLNSIETLNYNDCDNFEIYTLRDEIIDGESAFSEESEELTKQDIHAKIYVVENEECSDLYLGSLNASDNALYGNIEVMIKLQANKDKLNVDKLANDLFNDDRGGPKDPFFLRNVDEFRPDERDKSDDLDLIVKYISRLNSSAKVTFNGDFYDMSVDFDDFDKNRLNGVNVSIRPLLSNKTCNLSYNVVFNKLDKLSLSEFFVINIDDDSEYNINRIIKIKTEGMPEDRQKEVISSIITDEDAFIRYVAFLLGDEYVLTVENNFSGNFGEGMTIQLPELYEKMLKATIYSPEKFKDLEFLIESLSNDNVIPDGFEEMYNTFLEVL